MDVPFVTAEDLRARVSYEDAIDALERALRVHDIDAPQRTVLSRGDADLLLMPAWGPRGLGVKLVTVNPGNPPAHPLIHALYVLFDAGTTEPLALFDGEALTALRTAALSALATKHLARDDASHLVVFGAGTQARAHVEAMRAVRRIGRVTIVSRTPGSAERLAADVGAEVADPGAVGSADVICTCTTAREPLFDADLLPASVHVNAVGSYRPDVRELPASAFADASVVVESAVVAMREAGDVVLAAAEGVFDPADLIELGEIVDGNMTTRERTIFKSVGAAWEDLAVALRYVHANGS